MFGSNRGVWPAWLIMFVLALLLGWIPFLGPAIAGFVGGLQAGDVRSSLTAAIIPSLIVAAFLLLLGLVFTAPIIGALVGAGAFIVLLIGTVPLLLGALIGGWMGERPTSTGRV